MNYKSNCKSNCETANELQKLQMNCKRTIKSKLFYKMQSIVSNSIQRNEFHREKSNNLFS